MELIDLAIFKAVVEEGGIVRAARKLHRVQSSVTMRIKQLEAAVGAQLFYRNRQRLFLSPSGEKLLAYADKLLRLADEAKSAVSGAPPSGTLRLGALESTSASRLPDVLGAYHRAYPNVRVELSTGTNDALTSAVAERRLDAAFVAETPGAKELAALPLFAERLVLISAREHAPIRRPQDIEGDTLIAFPNGCAYRRVVQRWLGDTRVASVRVLELGSYHAIVACVASGTGIALVPESVLATVRHAEVAKHALPKIYANVVTPLIWRAAEESTAVNALRRTLGTARATSRVTKAA
jgi:DNA-binding transcriptional LysR family regulator